jgi:hypothetical protein
MSFSTEDEFRLAVHAHGARLLHVNSVRADNLTVVVSIVQQDKKFQFSSVFSDAAAAQRGVQIAEDVILKVQDLQEYLKVKQRRKVSGYEASC